MTPDPSDLQQALELFRAQFAQSLPRRMEEARGCLEACRASPGDDERLRDLHRVLHRLAGSAGTFGMPEFGDACRAIEDQLDALLARTGRTPDSFDAVARSLEALRPSRPPAAA
jgi:HPt (histidine-containing phosphotransfer) domain-containing protein